MVTADAVAGRGVLLERGRRRLLRHGRLIPALPAIALMILWAGHDGGYDTDTWYWGALVLLTLLVVAVGAIGVRPVRLSRAAAVALGALATYTAWSYASIGWAQAPGLALQGSNRTLLYLLLFTLLLVLPWTPKAALAALVVFVLGVGAIGLLLLIRLAAGEHVAALIVQGRLVAPTYYFNSTVALFMIEALLAVALAVRRELPRVLRGVLLALACAGLQLCVLGQSRGWLFTLPLVVLATFGVVRTPTRYALGAIIPVGATVVPLHLLLNVFTTHRNIAMEQAAATHAARVCLIISACAFAGGTIMAWVETRVRLPAPTRWVRAVLGGAVGTMLLAGACVGVLSVTHGHPVAFVARQWRGFSHPQAGAPSGSHFEAVGSGRYDFWRVSLEALRARPLGGLGQDNFADYYVTHRRTGEEPASSHSIEMSLLAETGLVGFALFAVFIVAAMRAALRAPPTRSELSRAAAGAAMVPLMVWLIHGSVDWFWEMPAISAPALGFLAVAASLKGPRRSQLGQRATPDPLQRAPTVLLALAAIIVCTGVLGFPYLSVRKLSIAADVAARNPAQALIDLRAAAALNPLAADPGRLAGTIALQMGQYETAERWFAQAASREPHGWYGWLGAGLAASVLGRTAVARHDYSTAAAINPREPVIREALVRVGTAHPLTPAAALRRLVLVG